MRVDEFGFGFPPRLFSKKKGETTYSFNLLPFGGFVKIYGEDPEKEQSSNGAGGEDEQRLFYKFPVWRRTAVVIAGVVMNVLLAYVLFAAGHMLGTPSAINDSVPAEEVQNVQVQLVAVNEGSPAAEAGLQPQDHIVALRAGDERVDVSRVSQVQEFIDRHLGEEITFVVARGEETRELAVFARPDPPEGQGATGVSLVRVGLVRSAPHTALWEGAKTTWNLTGATLSAFGGMISRAVTQGEVPRDVSGPVGIAVLTGTVRDLGASYVVQFIAIISLNLAILNLIPFPALDGGRLVFLFAEKLKGSPVSKKVEGIAHATGFALLILLIIFITFHDINRFF